MLNSCINIIENITQKAFTSKLIFQSVLLKCENIFRFVFEYTRLLRITAPYKTLVYAISRVGC